MYRFTFVLAALALVACSDDSPLPELADASGDSGDAANLNGADVGVDASIDLGATVDMTSDTSPTRPDASLDAGPDEPCPDGNCSMQDCVDNAWVPPSNLARDTMPLCRDETVALTWQQFFGLPFPRGNREFLEIEPDKYVAIQFDTNTFRDEARVTFDNPQGSYPYGSRLVTISQCPGYFGPSPYPRIPAVVSTFSRSATST